MSVGKYEEAIAAFEAMNGYKDSAEQIGICRLAINERNYNVAVELYNAGKYEEAIAAFEAMNGYKDSVEQINTCQLAIKEYKYNTAKSLMDAGKYDEAYTAFSAIKGHKDVDALLSTDDHLLAAALELFKQVGGYVTYGHFEQDNDTSNGKEAIEWLVLDYNSQTNQALLLSRYGLDARCYHKKTPYPTWKKSDIREWLNEDFLNAAFTKEERSAIVNAKISTPKSYENRDENETQDRVWLLSREEAEKYFTDSEARKTIPTKYAVAQGAYQNVIFRLNEDGCCRWWLRSPGGLTNSASVIAVSGYVSNDNIISTSYAVRPTLWHSLKALKL